MKIYITRHGETEWNKAGKMQGWKNSNLTEKGIENAKKLGESLRNIDFDCVYCSPLGRAVDTAECIIGDKDTEIVLKESLKEMGFGLWEGMEHEKIEKLYPTQQFNLWNRPDQYEPIDGESFEEVISRAKGVLDEIINYTGYENVLIVSHAIFIKAICSIVKKYSIKEFWNPPFMYDTCLTVLEVKDKKINLILEADTSHLD